MMKPVTGFFSSDWRTTLVLLFLLGSSHLAHPDETHNEQTFSQLLLESGLVFSPHPELEEASIPALDQCNKRLSRADKKIALCIMIRPIGRMQINYDDPHSSAPDPNQIYPLLFESLINTLSDHQERLSQAYSPQQAQALFGADWANAAAFNLSRKLAHASNALLVATHKHDLADVYLLFTYSDDSLARSYIPEYLGLLKFGTGQMTKTSN